MSLLAALALPTASVVERVVPVLDVAARATGAAVGPAPWAARLADVTLNPSTGSLPGGATLQQLTNGLGGWALILALVGLVVGAAAWALGVHSQNYHQSFIGRRAVLVSGAAALLIGAAPTLINFFFHVGTGVH